MDFFLNFVNSLSACMYPMPSVSIPIIIGIPNESGIDIMSFNYLLPLPLPLFDRFDLPLPLPVPLPKKFSYEPFALLLPEPICSNNENIAVISFTSHIRKYCSTRDGCLPATKSSKKNPFGIPNGIEVGKPVGGLNVGILGINGSGVNRSVVINFVGVR